MPKTPVLIDKSPSGFTLNEMCALYKWLSFGPVPKEMNH